MRSTLFVFCALLAISSAFGANISGEFNTDVAVKANTANSITFGGPLGPVLTITTDGDANIKLSLFINTTLPTGFNSIDIGASVGYTIDITPSTVNVVSASLKTPPFSAAILALLNLNTQIGALKFDANTNAFGQLEVSSLTLDQRVEIELPPKLTRGTVLLVTFNTNAFTPILFDQVAKLKAGVQKVYQYASSLNLTVTVQTENTIVVQSTASNPTNEEPEGMISLGIFYQIDLGVEASVDATIKATYDKVVAADKAIDEATIRLGFYNTTAKAWQFMTNGQVDVNAAVVTQTTTHFSTWGVYGQEADASMASSVTVAFGLVAALLAATL